MLASKPLRRLALATVLALGAHSALAQTVGPRITVGSNPQAVAVNPVTNKVYVANAGTTTGPDTVTVINGATFGTATVGVGDNPRWIGINVETNRVYVSNLVGPTFTSVIDGSTDTVVYQAPSGGGGWTAINPLNDTAYVIRYGSADEFNTIVGLHYELTSASHSFEPVSIAVNPVNNRLYMANKVTGDISANDVSTPTPYPPLLCPNGSGGFKPDPVPPVASPGTPCIDVANTPVSVAINPVTNTVYALSNSGTNSISIINGSNHTHTAVTPSGAPTGGKVIAVNPISNKVYALYASHVVVLDAGAGNATTVIASPGGPTSIGINVLTNTAYVANADGTLLVIAGNNSTSTLSLTPGSSAVAVDPVHNKVYVLDSASGVTVVNGAAGTPTSTGITVTINPLSGNTGGSSGTLNLSASSTMTPAPLNQVRRVWFRIDGGAWTRATGAGPYVAGYSGLSNGSHTIEAFATNSLESPNINTDLASVPIVGNISSYTFTVSTASPAAGISPTALDFGGQSMGTTSPPQTVTVTNTGTGTLTVSGVAVSNAQFSQTNNCTTGLSAGQSCTVTVTFNPAVVGGAALNDHFDVNGTLTITHNGLGSPGIASLEGVSEKSLVSHYYRSILRRAPEAAGVDYWEGEARRVSLLGANINEAWFALAQTFFSSPEYKAFNRTDSAFLTDLYKTFFNREPDSAGLNYWAGQLAQGMPRDVVLVEFMLGTEFRNFAQSIFGNTAVRAEIDVTTDFYRGILSRAPDDSGFGYWVGRFRTAQCQGGNAVLAAANDISGGFANSPEYGNRARTNAEFVADMYNAFLRRGGDLAGVQYWIDQLNTGARTRDNVRLTFIQTPEFQQRVQAIINQGCQS
jgi:DNA-binding beta-propeller fold protein YncE